MRRIAVFAAEEMGLKVVEHFAREGVDIPALALMADDAWGLNGRIAEAAGTDVVLHDTDLYSPDGLERLRSLDLDLVFLAWWPHIIRQPLLGVPRLGFMNMHPSLIPYNRGKHYYFWNLVEQVPFGVTLHLIDADIDSGHICFQSRIPTTWEDTGGSLRRRAMDEILALFKRSFRDIVQGEIPRIRPNLEEGTFHWGSELEAASRLDLAAPCTAGNLLNIIRGRSGFDWGGAWFEEDGARYEVTVNIKRVDNE